MTTLLAITALLVVPPRTAAEHTSTPLSVDIRLRTGGALSGKLVDSTDHGLVIAVGDAPFVFSWRELEPRSAYQTRLQIIDSQRGGRNHHHAEDAFALGMLALGLDRPDLAAGHFQTAVKLNPEDRVRVDRALESFRKRRAHAKPPKDPFPAAPAEVAPTPSDVDAGLDVIVRRECSPDDRSAVGGDTPPEITAKVMDVYRTFGDTVRRVIGKSMALVETEHFLIWTDWDRRHHHRLSAWCESMYAAMAAQFGVNPARPVFAAKCPMFCFRAKSRFHEFARLFDGFDARNTLGYTRSIESAGHVHVVLLRPGDTEADFDQFAVTLVHEGTHAFVHRWYSTRLIPHWVNEGLADMMAERVLGDACDTWENAQLLARQVVRYEWPLSTLLSRDGPIEVHQYPLAHSIVAYLHERNPRSFQEFIRALKSGRTITDALSVSCDGLTLEGLESEWRDSVRKSSPP